MKKKLDEGKLSSQWNIFIFASRENVEKKKKMFQNNCFKTPYHNLNNYTHFDGSRQ
jgi:hypothetical protein